MKRLDIARSTATDPFVACLWLGAFIACIPGVDAMYVALFQLLVIAAQGDAYEAAS